MSKDPRRPAAFPLDELDVLEADYVAGAGAPPALTRGADPFAEAAPLPAASAPLVPRPGRRWLRVLMASLGGLVVLATGLAIDDIIRGLFARNDALGLLGVALAALAAVALVALAGREIVGLLRVRRIVLIHGRAVDAAAADDRNGAREVVRELIGLYAGRPETARGRAALAGHSREIIDGRDLIGLAERELLLTFDDGARRMVLSSAKRVALVTAISPRALVDLIFVGSEILRLVRRLATLYGGRPGTLGFLKLTRAALSHLAVTGGMAAGDSLIQQILGHGIAARLSARLGEGVVNGLLTARVGIAAIEVCRPLPFQHGRPPRLADVMSELARLDKSAKE
jgi:putative membrane protein